MELDINQALYFLDMLDPGGRHTIASEAPFGGPDNGPKWEPGCTFEAHQRDFLIKDIQERQARKSNVYYSVNRPCKVSQRQGWWGKNNIDDIIAIRAIGFDIDVLVEKEIALNLIKEKLNGEMQPSMVISTGGGYHLIYFLSEKVDVHLFRPANTDEEKESNEKKIKYRSEITNLAHDFEAMLRAKFPDWKVDNMSNVDRVLRLPGTVNYPKLEKLNKGQKVALSYIAIDNHQKTDIHQLRSIVPQLLVLRQQNQKQPFIPRKDSKWTAYKKALACCEFIRDEGLADTNEWYTLNVMLPLIGAIHDPNEANQLSIEEAEECFMEAISGGARYGIMGRGQGYFMRQWRSHRPELARMGTKSLGGLIWAAQQNGMKLPWINEVSWENEFDRQAKWLEEQHHTISQTNKDLFD